jgi:hypothetical protein
MKLTFENNLKTLRYLVVHQTVCNRHRILPFFELLDEPKATFHAYVTPTAQSRAIIELRPTADHCMHDCLVTAYLRRSTGRLEPEML